MLAGALAIPAVLLHPWLTSGATTLQAAGTSAWDALTNVTTGIVGGLLQFFAITPPSGPLDPVPASLLGAVLMVVAFWLVGQAASGIWAGWDQREREIALQPEPTWRPLTGVVVPLALCGVGALGLLLFAGSGSWLLAAPSAALVLVAEVVAFLAPKGSVTTPPDP
jgi:hypothetical protein